MPTVGDEWPLDCLAYNAKRLGKLIRTQLPTFSPIGIAKNGLRLRKQELQAPSYPRFRSFQGWILDCFLTVPEPFLKP